MHRFGTYKVCNFFVILFNGPAGIRGPRIKNGYSTVWRYLGGVIWEGFVITVKVFRPKDCPFVLAIANRL